MSKKLGDYPQQISPKLYATVPKSVFAGIVANGGASLETGSTTDQYIAREWVLMYDQQCVDSAPPAWVRKIAQVAK